MAKSTSTRVNVAVGLVIKDDKILIAKRHAHQHQGNCWEFPGGKVEPNETTEQALGRELKEEVGIHVTQSDFLFTIEHDYDDKHVALHIFNVVEFNGEPRHQEQQPMCWRLLSTLSDLDFPLANQPILDYLNPATGQ
ncbi:MAG: 8-oxo-dGTP diphosphatase MutT [Coxiella sp. (in: Bacteria)]|nr:MAG: 8-oxo-dGTP diphosphatase MutT [Coxiella sp. (in: g-proteobacteria)]